MAYKDPKQPTNLRIKDLVSRMTLNEKIGQMVQTERLSATRNIMKRHSVGSVLSAGGSAPFPNATAEDWINMVNDFQRGALSSRLGIPMIYGIDAVHGHNTVYNATIFPHNVGLGVTRDRDLAKRIGAATALEVRATGITYTFAPSVAVCRDPRWGRCYESYSEDTRIVQGMSDIISGLQGDNSKSTIKGIPYFGGRNNVIACAKHFIGDGGTVKGINENDTIIPMDKLLKIHMPPYVESISKGVASVMISYSSLNGQKMHTNKKMITGYLKNKLNFKGFVISDMGGVEKITTPRNYTYSIISAIQAGIDVVMLSEMKLTHFIGELSSLVTHGYIPMERINDAVSRILLVKFNMGIFEEPLADISLVSELGSKDHRELAREAVRKSLVLLKNGKNVSNSLMVPLPKKAPKVLVSGSHANNLGYQCGGWTITHEGVSGNNYTTGTTILDAMISTVDSSTEVIFHENPGADFVASGNFAYAVVAVGEYPYEESGGDSQNLTMVDPGPEVIKNVCGAVKCVVIVISGRPIVIEPYISSIDVLVAAWLPGTEGQGITDVLYGDYGFTGKLARTWFKTVDQLPMNFGDSHYDPLFALGFGLTTESSENIIERSSSAGTDERPYVT